MTRCEESAVSAISAKLRIPVTLTQARRLSELWAEYYGAAVAYYGDEPAGSGPVDKE